MDLSLTDEQRELYAAAARFVRAERPTDRSGPAAGPGSAAWATMAELGWLSLCVSEADGGAGASLMDAGILAEALGTGPLPGPFLESAVVAPHVLDVLERTPARADLLGDMMNGTAVLTVCVADALDLPPTARGQVPVLVDGRLHGRVAPVTAADHASHHVVVADSGGGAASVVVVPADAAGVRRRDVRGFGPGLSALEFDDVRPVPGLLAELGPDQVPVLRDALIRALPVVCAFQVGSAQTVLDMAVRYSNERVQFGRPIGSFQRVQDHVIDLLNGLDSARWSTYYALAEGSAVPTAAYVAKAVTSEAHFRVCDSAHEVHAGAGCDVDYGLAPHTYLSRRAYGWLGEPGWHRRALIRALQLGKGTSLAPDDDGR